MPVKSASLLVIACASGCIIVALSYYRTVPAVGDDGRVYVGEAPVARLALIGRGRAFVAAECSGNSRLAVLNLQDWPAVEYIGSGANEALLAGLVGGDALVQTDTGFAVLGIKPGRPLLHLIAGDMFSGSYVDCDPRTNMILVAHEERISAVSFHLDTGQCEKQCEIICKDRGIVGPFSFWRFVDDGERIVFMDGNNDLIDIYDRRDGTNLETATMDGVIGGDSMRFTGHILSVIAIPGSDAWVVTTSRRKISILRPSPLRMVAVTELDNPFRPAMALAVSADGDLIAIVPFVDPKAVVVLKWNRANAFNTVKSVGLERSLGAGGATMFKCAVFSVDGKSLFIGCDDGSVLRLAL